MIEAEPKQLSVRKKHRGQELRFYCITCQTLICSDGMVKDHKGHDCDLLTDVVHKRSTELVQHTVDVEALQRTLQHQIAHHKQQGEMLVNAVASMSSGIEHARRTAQLTDSEDVFEVMQSYEHIVGGLCAFRDNQYQVLLDIPEFACILNMHTNSFAYAYPHLKSQCQLQRTPATTMSLVDTAVGALSQPLTARLQPLTSTKQSLASTKPMLANNKASVEVVGNIESYSLYPRRPKGEKHLSVRRDPIILTAEILKGTMHLTETKGAKDLDICRTAIKKACRKLNI